MSWCHQHSCPDSICCANRTRDAKATAVAEPPAWQAVDWVMKSISLAIHVALSGNETELAAELSLLHEKARQRRDRA